MQHNIGRTNHQHRLERQRGAFVMNAILAIVLITFIAIMAFSFFNTGREKERVGQAKSLITALDTGIKAAYVNDMDYSNITTEEVIESGAVPTASLVGHSIIATPWYSNNSGSVVSVAPASNKGQFMISLADIPSDACINVGANFLNTTGVAVSANGTTVTTNSGLDSACQSSPSTLSFTF